MVYCGHYSVLYYPSSDVLLSTVGNQFGDQKRSNCKGNLVSLLKLRSTRENMRTFFFAKLEVDLMPN